MNAKRIITQIKALSAEEREELYTQLLREDPNLKNLSSLENANCEEELISNSLPDDTIIWRYLDFWKYEKMLETNSIHFTYLNCFDDPHEGLLSKSQIKRFLERRRLGDPSQIWLSLIALRDGNHSGALSCWAIKSHESYLLWKSYTNCNNSIVIKTTLGALKASFQHGEGLCYRYMKVVYLDFEKCMTDSQEKILGDLIWAHKSIEYEDENELRINLTSVNFAKTDLCSLKDRIVETKKGLAIPINIRTLVSELIVHPNATDEFVSKVKEMHRTSEIPEDIVMRSKILPKSVDLTEQYETITETLIFKGEK